MNNDTTNSEVNTTDVGTEALGTVSEVLATTELSEEVLDILPAVAEDVVDADATREGEVSPVV